MACVQMVPPNDMAPVASELHGSCVHQAATFYGNGWQPLTTQVTLTRTVIPMSCGKEGLVTWLTQAEGSCVTTTKLRPCHKALVFTGWES